MIINSSQSNAKKEPIILFVLMGEQPTKTTGNKAETYVGYPVFWV